MKLLAIAISVAAGLVAQEITLVRVTDGVPSPTGIENAGDGSGRLFVLQQDGRIRIVKNGVLAADPFLDIRDKTRAGGERGLLGLAFPPGFATKQRFYVNYTDLNGDTIIAQYRVLSAPDRADAASETVLLKIAQPFENHNGGGCDLVPMGTCTSEWATAGRREIRTATGRTAESCWANYYGLTSRATRGICEAHRITRS